MPNYGTDGYHKLVERFKPKDGGLRLEFAFEKWPRDENGEIPDDAIPEFCAEDEADYLRIVYTMELGLACTVTDWENEAAASLMANYAATQFPPADYQYSPADWEPRPTTSVNEDA